MTRYERYTDKLHVHLEENGAVEITSHPSMPASVHAGFHDVIIHDWRHAGGDADYAKWISRELDRAADEAPEAREETDGGAT